MNLSNIIHTGYHLDCYPIDDDTIIVNIRTGKEIDKVFIFVGDPFSAGISSGEHKWSGDRLEMEKTKEFSDYYIWSISVNPEYKRLKYHFEICSMQERVYLLADGFHKEINDIPEDIMIQRFLFPWMNNSDINKVPEWVADTVWYQIFPDRYCRANHRVKRNTTEEWVSKEDKSWDLFYGGDIKGIESRLGSQKIVRG